MLHALIKPGDKIMGLSLAHGGHLTHGMKINFSGRLYEVAAYTVEKDTKRLDMDKVREMALAQRPQVLIAGWSAYPRHLDFQAFRSIADEVGAYLWTDMAHFAGLVAAGLHPSPVPYSDVTSTTIHKTIGGPRSGMILSRDAEAFGKKLNSAVFPGQQGGPLMHVVAAKAVALKIAGTPEFKDRMQRVLNGAQILAERLGAPDCKAAGMQSTGGKQSRRVIATHLQHQIALSPAHLKSVPGENRDFVQSRRFQLRFRNDFKDSFPQPASHRQVRGGADQLGGKIVRHRPTLGEVSGHHGPGLQQRRHGFNTGVRQ